MASHTDTVNSMCGNRQVSSLESVTLLRPRRKKTAASLLASASVIGAHSSRRSANELSARGSRPQPWSTLSLALGDSYLRTLTYGGVRDGRR
jgi:hypothetical protein